MKKSTVYFTLCERLGTMYSSSLNYLILAHTRHARYSGILENLLPPLINVKFLRLIFTVN